ncbi:aldolase catalytic domain-containing protein [Alcanivorax sediminis]|uniref:aldolase catalytic domain-containing protein n=1 Tax=Alcanivorax sediminis TaxID=2663008 RepID=UPI002E274C07
MIDNQEILLDCTLRDGGYYNSWDFPVDVVITYAEAMCAAGVDYVELGLRSLSNNGYKGPFAFTTDSYLRSLSLPEGVNYGVMVNAGEILKGAGLEESLKLLFPESQDSSPVSLVRVACHIHEFEAALPAAQWLKDKGYTVGFNLMQIASCSDDRIRELGSKAKSYPIDVLYFADSLGGMGPEDVERVIAALRVGWSGDLGIHTHDNMRMALQNTLTASKNGVVWLDSTVTGMGRGPGNARTEELLIEKRYGLDHGVDMMPLLRIIDSFFKPLQEQCGWGSNPYYFLSGKYGIHPTYVQEMLTDSRYSEEDIIAVLDYLKTAGGAGFSSDKLEAARHFYSGVPYGAWSPESVLKGRDLLLLGTGPGVEKHKVAIEQYIKVNKPVVIALNAQSIIASELIDFRAACHPARLLADIDLHVNLPQPLITPASMLPGKIKSALSGKTLYDFGVGIESNTFEFGRNYCVLPSSLVVAYALALAASGKAERVYMAGFDGYSGEDPRNQEMNALIRQYEKQAGSIQLYAVTPTRYDLEAKSIYGAGL